MIKVNWIITDSIENVSIEEFNKDWNGIYGYFEIHINSQVLGFCPNRELLLGEEGNEDILYWLSKLSEAITHLSDGQAYEIQSFSMNLAKLKIKKDKQFVINLVDANTEKIIWQEMVTIEEICNELKKTIEIFLAKIKNDNMQLLKTEMVKRLIFNYRYF